MAYQRTRGRVEYAKGGAMAVRSEPIDDDLEAALRRAAEYLEATGDVGEPEDYRQARRTLAQVVDRLPRGGVDPQGAAREAILGYARSWYQDPEANAWRCLDEAWRILSDHFDLRKVEDPELLGEIGNIHRRRWTLSGQTRDLRRSLIYYELGFRRGDRSNPSTALNGFVTALLMVELARLQERALFYLQEPSDYSARVPPIDELESDPAFGEVLDQLQTQTATELRERADEVRTEVVARLEDLAVQQSDDFKLHAAYAGSLFGLRRYDESHDAAQAAARQTQRSERELQEWAHEFVLMARQRGIRPEAEAIKQASEKDEWVSRLAVARRFRHQDRALSMRLAGATFEEIAAAIPYPDPETARYAVLNEEQYHVLRIVRALLRASDETIDEDMVLSAFTGKVGLALSGGGFRAALYHVGVLAALADLNLLRHVQVISCVSGGSIVGAHYYMLVKQLLEETPDEDIDSKDLSEVVQRLCDGMLAAVDRNLRARLFTNPWANLRMLAEYSPSQRLGDLIARFALPDVEDHALRATGDRLWVVRQRTRFLRQLAIHPRRATAEEGVDFDFRFKPKRHNWRRAVKVPVLVLNATSLNTGHNWQFTALHMGEPPAIIHPEIDANPRLRRVFFNSERPQSRAQRAVAAVASPVTERLRRRSVEGDTLLAETATATLRDVLDSEYEEDAPPIEVGHAVAASAAVPGIFEPLTLGAGYPPMIVKLADGGVVDNQGVTGLLEQGCDILLVSDASGQLTPRDRPAGGLFPALRSSLIASQRIRAAQYEELKTLRRSQLIRDFMFVHLNQGLDSDPIGWHGVTAVDGSRRVEPREETGYGVDREIQTALARLRTDLDSFSEAESFALMTSGYLATRCSVMRQGVGPFRPGDSESCEDIGDSERDRWRFLEIESLVGDEPEDEAGQERLLRHLRRGSRRLLRSAPMSPKASDVAGSGSAPKAPWLAGLVIPLLLTLLLVVVWNADESFGVRIGTPRVIVLAALILAGVVAAVGLWYGRWAGPLEIIWKVVLFSVALVWMPLAWLYLSGRRVLPRSGSLARLRRKAR